MKKNLIILFVSILGFSAAYAQKPAIMVSEKDGWHKISETTVNFNNDKDEIIIMGADKFKALKFKVTDGAINLIDLEVYYSEGDKEDIKVNSPVAEGKESRVIDLKGNDRDLKKVVFVYGNLKDDAKKDKAHVELYGLK